MGLMLPRCPSRAEIEYKMEQKRRHDVRDIALALLSGGFDGSELELIRKAERIDEALRSK